MDLVRYGLAWILVVLLPPAVVAWFVVHPFARFWRRVGRGLGVVAAFALLIACAVGLALVAPPLLVVEYGFSWWLTVPAIALFVAALVVQRERKKQLTLRILMGFPEVSSDPSASRLLTDGIYARIRHPRYVEIVLACVAYALVANYLAGYVALAVTGIGLHLLVVIEERELRERFGGEWEAYAARTPRYWPRRRGGAA